MKKLFHKKSILLAAAAAIAIFFAVPIYNALAALTTNSTPVVYTAPTRPLGESILEYNLTGLGVFKSLALDSTSKNLVISPTGKSPYIVLPSAAKCPLKANGNDLDFISVDTATIAGKNYIFFILLSGSNHYVGRLENTTAFPTTGCSGTFYEPLAGATHGSITGVQFSRVATQGDYLYVASTSSTAMQIYRIDMTSVSSFGSLTSPNVPSVINASVSGFAGHISGMAFDAAGNLYVSTQNTIYKSLKNGSTYGNPTALHTETAAGTDFADLAVGKMGEIYIADKGTVKIEMYCVSGPCRVPTLGPAESIPTGTLGTVIDLATNNSIFGFSVPTGIDVDRTDNTIFFSVDLVPKYFLAQGDQLGPTNPPVLTSPLSNAIIAAGTPLVLTATFTPTEPRRIPSYIHWVICNSASCTDQSPSIVSQTTTQATKTATTYTLDTSQITGFSPNPGTPYFWNARMEQIPAGPGGTESAYSGTEGSFTIDPPPNAPTLSEPADNATFFAKQPVTLKATYAVGQSTSTSGNTIVFELCTGVPSTPTSAVCGGGTVVESIAGVTATTSPTEYLVAVTLSHSTTYSWRAKGVSGTSQSGDFTPFRTFTIVPPLAPTLETPANDAVFPLSQDIDLSAIFNGNPNRGTQPVNTTWEVCSNSSCGTIVYTQTVSTNNGSSPLKETHTISAGTLATGTYHWRATSFDEPLVAGRQGVAGLPSATWVFHVHSYTQVPEITSPVGVTNSLNPTLTSSAFQPVATTPGHALAETQWQLCANFNCEDLANIICDSGYRSASLTSFIVPPRAIEPGKQYVYRVRYKDNQTLPEETVFSEPQLLAATSTATALTPPPTTTCTASTSSQPQPYPTTRIAEHFESTPGTVGTVIPNILNNPGKIALENTMLWIADTDNHAVHSLALAAFSQNTAARLPQNRKIASSFGGTDCVYRPSTQTCQDDTIANNNNSLFSNPLDVAVHSASGTAVILDQNGTTIRRLCVNPLGCTFNGAAVDYGFIQTLLGDGTSTTLSATAVEIDTLGNIFYITGNEVKALKAQSTTASFYGTTPACPSTNADYCNPVPIPQHSVSLVDFALQPAASASNLGTIWYATATEVYEIETSGTVTKKAGTGQLCVERCGINGPALSADLGTIESLSIIDAPTGLVYLGQTEGGILELDITNSKVKKIAGFPHDQNVLGSNTGPGPAELYRFHNPVSVARVRLPLSGTATENNQLLVVEQGQNTIKTINLTPATVTGAVAFDTLTAFATEIAVPATPAAITYTPPTSCTNCFIQVDQFTLPTAGTQLVRTPVANSITAAGLYSITLVHPNRSVETKLLAVGHTAATEIKLGGIPYSTAQRNIFEAASVATLQSQLTTFTFGTSAVGKTLLPYAGTATPLYGNNIPIILLSTTGTTYGIAKITVWPPTSSRATTLGPAAIDPEVRPFMSTVYPMTATGNAGNNLQSCLSSYTNQFLSASTNPNLTTETRNDLEFTKRLLHFCLKWLKSSP